MNLIDRPKFDEIFDKKFDHVSKATITSWSLDRSKSSKKSYESFDEIFEH